MPDKGAHGFGFACDGPGKGGSCDISGSKIRGCKFVLVVVSDVFSFKMPGSSTRSSSAVHLD